MPPTRALRCMTFIECLLSPPVHTGPRGWNTRLLVCCYQALGLHACAVRWQVGGQGSQAGQCSAPVHVLLMSSPTWSLLTAIICKPWLLICGANIRLQNCLLVYSAGCGFEAQGNEFRSECQSDWCHHDQLPGSRADIAGRLQYALVHTLRLAVLPAFASCAATTCSSHRHSSSMPRLKQTSTRSTHGWVMGGWKVQSWSSSQHARDAVQQTGKALPARLQLQPDDHLKTLLHVMPMAAQVTMTCNNKVGRLLRQILALFCDTCCVLATSEHKMTCKRSGQATLSCGTGAWHCAYKLTHWHLFMQDDADQLRPVTLPDVPPHEIVAKGGRPGLLSMAAGDFVVSRCLTCLTSALSGCDCPVRHRAVLLNMCIQNPSTDGCQQVLLVHIGHYQL
jgi:hypothetical protein